MLEVLDTGISLAEENMSLDARLLENLSSNGNPILHLYDWAKPSATFGYFVEPENHLNLKKGSLYSLDLARRPTGGGIIFHIWDLAFSFLMPSEHPYYSLDTLKNYQFVNRVVLEVVQAYFSLSGELITSDAPSLSAACKNFCMAKPTQYDVVYQGTKIAGAAQRRKRQGYLHQGTISLMAPDLTLLKEVLVSQESVVEAMASFTFAPIQNIERLKSARKELQKLLADKLQKALKF